MEKRFVIKLRLQEIKNKQRDLVSVGNPSFQEGQGKVECICQGYPKYPFIANQGSIRKSHVQKGSSRLKNRP